MSLKRSVDISSTGEGTKGTHDTHEVDDDYDTHEVEVELKPFRYMVGGHSYVLQVSRSAICKNYRQREASFYKSLPEELKPFTPKYLGEIYVTLHVADNRKRFTSSIPQSVARKCRLLENERYSRRFIAPADADEFSDTDDSKCCLNENKNSRYETSTCLEEWSNSCLARHNRSVGTWENKQSKTRFIMLENLLRGYVCPSVLDIKLGKCPKSDGTEPDQHFQDGSEQRIRFRIDGYQKFDVVTGNYTVLHKDITRHFSMERVIEEITNFFHDGTKLRTNIIDKILERLDVLQSIVKKEWRFDAASLLLMYDNSNVECRDHLKYMKSSCMKSNLINVDPCMSAFDVKSAKVGHIYTPESDISAMNSRNRETINGKCVYAISEGIYQLKSDCITSSSIAEGSCVHVDTDTDSCDHTVDDVKVDVKLIDFLKTNFSKHSVDVNDNNVEGIAFEILKLKDILEESICKDCK